MVTRKCAGTAIFATFVYASTASTEMVLIGNMTRAKSRQKYLKVAALLDELEAHMQTQLGYTGQDNDISDKSTVSKHSEHIAYEK